VHGICSVSNTLFTTDAAQAYDGFVRNNRLVILYDTFDITCKTSTSQPVTPEQVIQNLNTVDEYIQATVMNVKETNNLKEDSTTNGPKGKVSQKTQTTMELLLNGVKSLISKVTIVNPKYKYTFDWKFITSHNSREFTRGFAC